MKKIIFSSLLLASTTYAAQSIQISAKIAENSPIAELIFVINDLDQGKATPYVMSLKPGQNFQMFHVDGNHYQITQWTIQAPNLNFSACSPSQQISNKSLVVTLNGKIAADGLRCSSRETAALLQLSSNAVVNPAAAPTVATTSNDEKSGYAEIAQYLTALSQQCKKGDFHAKFKAQNIDYTILGADADTCKVAIAVNKEKPLICNFSNNDVALLASPTEIERYRSGSVDSSPNSLNTRIMNARCKSM